MKSSLVLILIMSLYSLELLAGPVCDVDAFKKQYVDLQNALRYDGQKIEYKNGKVKATSEAVDSENSPGKKAERALYKNYRAALGKVKKIYDYLKSPDKASADEKALLSNPEVSNFFKAIDPASSGNNTRLNVNIDKLLDSLQSKVKGKDFALNSNDVYLLKKLIIHSQDRICTLGSYVTPKKTNTTRVQYLEELKNKPLNLMIFNLRDMVGTEDLKFTNEDLAIDKAVEEGINNLHKMALNCKNKINALNLGETIQGCNYGKLIQSLSVDDKSFRSFEALLHFINANQVVTDGRTSLSWIDEQFKKDSVASCYVDPKSNSLYIKNLPVKKDKVDGSQFSCTKGSKELSGEACLQGLSYEFVNGMGHKVTASKQSGIKTITIKDSANCENISLRSPVVAPPTETEEQKCKKDEKKEWKNGKCEDKKAESQLPKTCNKDQCLKIEISGKFIEWHDEGKFCYTGNKGVAKDVAKQTAFCNEAGDLGQTETEESCKAKKQNFDPEKKTCTETAESCGEKKLGFDSTAKSCVENAESCKLKNKEFDDKNKICIEPPVAGPETEDSCKKKDQKLSDDKKSCVQLSDEEKCKKNDDDWLAGQTKAGESPISRYRWDGKTCVDKQDKKDGGSDKEKEDGQGDKETVYPNKPVPGRFMPVTIPSRQVFILPGMP